MTNRVVQRRMTEQAGAVPRGVVPKCCVIYARVSTDQNLDQEFNSLDAQREAFAAYIQSQRAEGWVLTKCYDDGGFSGGSPARPGVQQLPLDVQEGKVDVIVVYKVDRLTRSLADFAKLVELFDSRGASFVSVTPRTIQSALQLSPQCPLVLLTRAQSLWTAAQSGTSSLPSTRTSLTTYPVH